MLIFWQLFYTFFKIGLFTIGGGYAMIPLISQEVINNQWITAEQLTDFIAISESTPGPFAINTATFVGYESGGFLGACCATFGVILPSIIIIIFIAALFKTFSDNCWVKAGMQGLRPVVIGLLASSIILLSIPILFPISYKNNLQNNYFYLFCFTTIIIIIKSVSFYFKKIHPALLIILSGFLGLLLFGIIGQQNV